MKRDGFFRQPLLNFYDTFVRLSCAALSIMWQVWQTPLAQAQRRSTTKQTQDAGSVAGAPLVRLARFSQRALASGSGLLLLSGLWIVPPARADIPLLGPLVAFTNAAQDAIVLYDVGSETYRTLSLGAGLHLAWDFAPDGCRLLYTLSEGTEPAKLYSVRLDGSDPQALIVYPELPYEQWGAWEPHWSPDNTRIAFTMVRQDGQKDLTHIAWIPPQGGNPQFYSVSGTEFSPRWSPDGRRLAYISFEERAAGANMSATAVPTPDGQSGGTVATVQEADLWVVNADGSNKYAMTNYAVGSVTMPRWSPDGQLLSFIYSISNGTDTLWMIGTQSGAVPTQLTYRASWLMEMDWLPDSTAILASVREFRGLKENRLWQMPLVGVADDNATQYLAALPLTHTDYPRFSPDGAWLAVRTAYEIALVERATNELRLLSGSLGNTPPVWSPVGFAGEAACANP
jgi:Tol biopolymer transport system component